MTEKNSEEASGRQSFLQKLKSVKHIEIITAVLIAAVCIALFFALGGRDDKKIKAEAVSGEADLCRKLEEIISSIDGVGRCRILVTFAGSGRQEIAYDEETESSITTDSDGNGTRTEENSVTVSRPVTITVDGKEQVLVIATSPAEIEGIVVVAEGGADIYTKIKIVDAICALTSVDGGSVKVFAMK